MKRKDCIFCDIASREVIYENDLFYSNWDLFPVSKGHALITPKRHIKSFFDLKESDLLQLYQLINKTKKLLDKKYTPDGYNIGINDGEAAGRTIHHLHIHLIPRYRGDVKDPRGGIRCVVP